MFKDFVPVCVFSEASQGQSFGSSFLLFIKYSSLCVLSNVIDNDHGVHMKPMPRMVGPISSNPKDKKKTTSVK
ncbi:hypothetical protein CRYUN_Cryun03dG0150800 [Craigia yunnanensis]